MILPVSGDGDGKVNEKKVFVMGSFFSICCCEERTNWLFDDSRFDLALACAVAPAAETETTAFVIPMGLGATGFFYSVRAGLESFSERIQSAAADFCCSVVSSIFQAVHYVERKISPAFRKIFAKALAPQDCHGRTPMGWRL